MYVKLVRVISLSRAVVWWLRPRRISSPAGASAYKGSMSHAMVRLPRLMSPAITSTTVPKSESDLCFSMYCWERSIRSRLFSWVLILTLLLC